MWYKSAINRKWRPVCVRDRNRGLGTVFQEGRRNINGGRVQAEHQKIRVDVHRHRCRADAEAEQNLRA